MSTPRTTDPTQMHRGAARTLRLSFLSCADISLRSSRPRFLRAVGPLISIGGMTRVLPALTGMLLLGACTANEGTIRTFQPPAGANEMLHGPIDAAPGHSLTMGDLVFAPNAPIARHFHAGEEFLYVMGGSIIISRHDEQDVIVAAGEGLRIPANTIHWGRAGSHGARGVASWIRIDGQALRTPVPN